MLRLNLLLLVIAVILAVLLIISYIFRRKLKQIFIRELRIVGKDLKRAEKKAAKEVGIVKRDIERVKK